MHTNSCYTSWAVTSHFFLHFCCTADYRRGMCASFKSIFTRKYHYYFCFFLSTNIEMSIFDCLTSPMIYYSILCFIPKKTYNVFEVLDTVNRMEISVFFPIVLFLSIWSDKFVVYSLRTMRALCTIKGQRDENSTNWVLSIAKMFVIAWRSICVSRAKVVRCGLRYGFFGDKATLHTLQWMTLSALCEISNVHLSV